MKYAQDLIKANNPQIYAGFNAFLFGWKSPKSSEYGDKSEWYAHLQGYQYAEKMAKENGIAFIHPFKCSQSESCFPFQYGGYFVCNTCGHKDVDRDWWEIQVEKDGNAFCCHGVNFVNLQESDNYAFGDTFEESIVNYRKTILKL